MTRASDADRRSFLAHKTHSLGLPSLFYGSLQAPEIFNPVVGAPLEYFESERVQLLGYKPVRVMAGDAFPGIFADSEAPLLPCLLVHGLSFEQRHRVAWYEWDEYRIERLTLTDGREAEAFIPHLETIERLHGPVDIVPWDYQTWRSNHLAGAAGNADGWMAEMPDISALTSHA